MRPPLPLVSAPWTARVAGAADAAVVQRWMSEPHVVKFWQQNWPLARWRDELRRQLDGTHSLPCVLSHEGIDLAYLEVYRVACDVLGKHCEHEPHDLGLHIAIGDLARTGRGLGRRALRAVADGLLAADPRSTQVLAEPDAGNIASLAAFAAAGFTSRGEITLPDKTAVLMTRRRQA